jgi:ethanolamine ammonia-lyase small subunit
LNLQSLYEIRLAQQKSGNSIETLPTLRHRVPRSSAACAVLLSFSDNWQPTIDDCFFVIPNDAARRIRGPQERIAIALAHHNTHNSL